MSINLQGMVVLVTGAGSGLGAATARAFGRAGARVACLDRNQHTAVQTAGELTSLDCLAIALGCDVSDEHAVQQAVAQVLEQFERIDVLVNNAAVDHTLSVAEMTVAQWDQVINVNLRGPFLLARAVWPAMQRQGGGQIVNVASTAATRAWANAAAYHASKWGLVGFSRGLGVEGRAHNIRVTTIYPGGMDTAFFERFKEQGIPLPEKANLQDPAVVADAIVYAVALPRPSALQELIITPMTETSWP